MTRLLYVESTPDVYAAIEREKQLKGWTRKRKLELVRELNPYWRDLSEEWFAEDTELVTSASKGQILRSAQNDKASAEMGQILHSAQNDNVARQGTTNV